MHPSRFLLAISGQCETVCRFLLCCRDRGAVLDPSDNLLAVFRQVTLPKLSGPHKNIRPCQREVLQKLVSIGEVVEYKKMEYCQK